MSKYPEKKRERHETDISCLSRAGNSIVPVPFIDKYNLHQQIDNLLWDKQRGMVVFRFKDTIQGKAIDPEQEPKCFTYSWNEKPYLAMKDREPSHSLLIVEDPCSAARASELIDSMALLGTTYHDTYTEYIKPYKKIYIALDHTATDKAIKLVQYIDILRPTELIILDTDVKDLSTEELDGLLGSASKLEPTTPIEEVPW